MSRLKRRRGRAEAIDLAGNSGTTAFELAGDRTIVFPDRKQRFEALDAVHRPGLSSRGLWYPTPSRRTGDRCQRVAQFFSDPAIGPAGGAQFADSSDACWVHGIMPAHPRP
jgi:hypothetical protein